MNLNKKIAMNTISGVGLLVMILMILGSTSQVHARGAPWYIISKKSPSADGVISLKVTLNQGHYEIVDVNVYTSDTPEDKAYDIADELDDTPSLDAEDVGQDVRVKINDYWTGLDDEIQEIKFTDHGTGEELHGVKDDPPSSYTPLVQIALDISGTGTSGGWYKLGIGELGALATVDTEGKTGAQIEQDLMHEFNVLYHGQYFGELIDGKVSIRDVPCPLGVVYGTNDTQLTYSLTMGRTGESIPTLTHWGLITLTILVIGSGIWLMLKRRRAVRV